MSQDTLEQLDAAMQAARRRLARARFRVAEAVKEVPDLKDRIAELRREEAELQYQHDLRQRHAANARNTGRPKKARRKWIQRDKSGQAKRQKRIEREALQDRVDTLWAQAESLRHELHLYALEKRYYTLRHQLLRAIAAQEAPEDMATKLAYARMAALPEPYVGNAEAIWMYEYARGGTHEIHLFYGGRTAPYGQEGQSPDGHGHGHHILRKNQDGVFELDFSRSPR